MNITTKIRHNLGLFKTLYVKHDYIGCRTTKRNISYVINNEKLIDDVLNNLFYEVPAIPRFGEGDWNRYYLLKKRWEIVYHFYITGCLIKSKPLRTFKYVWLLIRELFNINRWHRYYNNPDKYETR